jgi:hypothetical protein
MSNRSHDDRASRAEARRRARLIARGELPPDEPAEAHEAEPKEQGGGGFLRNLFPAAPPLPGRPDPLAGFDPSGPMRPIRERLFLLRKTWLVWVLAGIGALIGYVAYRFYVQGLLGVVGMFVMFGALIGAGWYGWQRPTLVGTAAGILSFVLVVGLVLVSFAMQGVPPDTFGTPGDLAAILAVEGLYQAGLGFLGGWYGGYLRRRQAQVSAQARRARR